jgi:hypothetical protein
MTFGDDVNGKRRKRFKQRVRSERWEEPKMVRAEEAKMEGATRREHPPRCTCVVSTIPSEEVRSSRQEFSG